MYDLHSSKVVIYSYISCFVPLNAVGHGNTAGFALASKPSKLVSFGLKLPGKIFKPVRNSSRVVTQTF